MPTNDESLVRTIRNLLLNTNDDQGAAIPLTQQRSFASASSNTVANVGEKRASAGFSCGDFGDSSSDEKCSQNQNIDFSLKQHEGSAKKKNNTPEENDISSPTRHPLSEHFLGQEQSERKEKKCDEASSSSEDDDSSTSSSSSDDSSSSSGSSCSSSGSSSSVRSST